MRFWVLHNNRSQSNINTGGKYPQYIKIQASKDKMALLDGINVGDTVTATCNVRGRMWQDTAFNSFEIYKLEKVGGSTQQQAPIQTHKADVMPSSAIDDPNPLPF